MASHRRIVYSFATLVWLLTNSAMGFGPQSFTDPDLPEIAYSPSYLGYGDLVPKGLGSELGRVTHEMLFCHSSSKEMAFSKEEIELIQKETQIIKQLLTVVLGEEQEEFSFLKVLQDSMYFYSSQRSFQKKIYSSKDEEWNKLPQELKEQGEKFLYLQNKVLPSENVKAVLMFDILKNKKGIAFTNLKNLFERSYFLIDDEYIKQSRILIQTLLKKEEDEYYAYIQRLSEIPFYKLGSEGNNLGKKVKRAFKLLQKGNDRYQFQDFLNFHNNQLKTFFSKSPQIEAMAIDQLHSEGKLKEPSCTRPTLEFDCQGVKKEKTRTFVYGDFQLEYFKAYRSYEIKETEDRFFIKVPLQFFLTDSLKKNEAEGLLEKWLNWAHEFYNQKFTHQEKQIEFFFDFQLTNVDDQKSINLRKCWNASRSSANCDFATQPDAKNFTKDLKKDALLEEIGHHMGLYDEYKMSYYHFNPLGASDSFMVAPENYRLYPHHIQMILAPHFLCQ